MKLNDIKNRELELIYKILSESNPLFGQEVEEATRQKNVIANRHIFDVLASRSMISYDEIAQAQKKLVADIEDLGRIVLLDKKSVDISVENGKFYINNSEVAITYLVTYEILSDTKARPLVIVPKDRYDALIIKKTQQLKGNGETEESFTITDVLKEAIAQKASDIHFKYDYHDQYNVSFKVHGHLIRQKQFTIGKNRADNFFNEVRQKVAVDTGSSFKSDEYNLPQGGKMRYDELGVDLRVQFTPSGRLDKKNLFVARILNKNVGSGSVGTIEDLNGYDDYYRDILRQAVYYRRGLKLVVGITNSGKSTLTSHFINSIPATRSIATAQDPIEYPKDGWHITEHQILETDDKETSIGFLDYIKAWKRSDQDVEEIGEIRKDKNNGLMEAVVEAVKAGNFVISTAHIHSAFDVPKALVGVFGVDRAEIADLLVLVTAQVLVEELCPYCKLEDTYERNIETLDAWNKKGNIKYAWKEDLEKFIHERPPTYLRNKNGCPHCNHTGIKGLTPIYEYYKPTVEMIDWLNKNLDTSTRFDIEREFCQKNDPNLARNKLSVYIDKLREGVVDTDIEILGKVLA